MSSHRGLSAVVGTVFLAAVVISAISYVSYSMETMGNFSESLIVEEKRQQEKQTEAFEIRTISVDGANKLDGVIKNTGEIPVQLKTMWIQGQDANDISQKFDLNAALSPGNTVNLIDLVDFDVDPTKGYDMKVVSSRGEVNSFYVNSAADVSLYTDIRTIPTYVPSTFTTTVLYTVVNNMSNNNALYNITPNPLNVTTVTGDEVGAVLDGPNPGSYPVLNPGEIAVFEYVVQLTGEVDDMVEMNATLTNGVMGNAAITTATVKEVTVATQAGTALESFGLSTEISSEADILLFHDESELTPNGEYQMDGSDVTGSGLTGTIETTTYTFLTANVTSDTNVLPGQWNATFGMYQELVPEGFPHPVDFAFMMECENCPSGGDIFDSTGNINDLDFEENGDPMHFTSGGPDNKGYFSFDGNDRFHAEFDPTDGGFDEHTDLNHWGSSQSLTTAVWVRIPPDGDDDYMPIVKWGDQGNDDEYEIAFGDDYDAGSNGNFVYRYSTSGSTDWTKCETDGSKNYDDNEWHFVVGARAQDDDCKLYVDGVLVDNTEECNGCSGSSLIDVDGTDDVYIGFGGGSEYLTGDVALFMHWNNEELTAPEIEDIWLTNYGINATRTNVKVEVVNGQADTVITSLFDGEYLFDMRDVSLKGESESDRTDHYKSDGDDKKYNQGNFTFTTSLNSTLSAGEKLRFTISWDTDEQNLPMHFRFDDIDADMVSMDLNSFLQTPDAVPNWPTFLSFDRDTEVQYTVFNSGPNGAWFTFGGTRFVVTNPDASASYGAMPISANGTTMSSIKDSIYFPDQTYATITFDSLKNPPQGGGGGTKPPIGQYNAAVFLNGFDDKGEVFLRTINLGSVNVHNNG